MTKTLKTKTFKGVWYSTGKPEEFLKDIDLFDYKGFNFIPYNIPETPKEAINITPMVDKIRIQIKRVTLKAGQQFDKAVISNVS